MKDNSASTFIGIIVVIIIVMGFFWYRSEENRLKLIDELNEANARIEELEHKLEWSDE